MDQPTKRNFFAVARGELAGALKTAFERDSFRERLQCLYQFTSIKVAKCYLQQCQCKQVFTILYIVKILDGQKRLNKPFFCSCFILFQLLFLRYSYAEYRKVETTVLAARCPLNTCESQKKIWEFKTLQYGR